MTIIQRLIAISIPLLMFCMGAVQILREIGSHLWITRWINRQLSLVPEISIFCFWILLVLLPWCWLLLKARGASGKKLLELSTESGSKINVREKAVNRYVQDCLDSMSFVRDVRVSTENNRGALAVTIRVWVAAIDKMDALQQRLVTTITEDLQRGFGIARILEPKVIIESVKTTPRRNRKIEKQDLGKETPEERSSQSFLPSATSPMAAPEALSEEQVLRYTPEETLEPSPEEDENAAADQPEATESPDEEEKDEDTETQKSRFMSFLTPGSDDEDQNKTDEDSESSSSDDSASDEEEKEDQ